MSRRLILHLGMYKTGSTSIQSAFHHFENDHVLYFPNAHSNHSRLLVNAFSSRRHSFFRNRVQKLGRGEVDRMGAEARERLARVFSETEKDVILSAEVIPGFFTSRDIRRFRDFVSPYFDRVQILTYLREPASFMTSGVQEEAKTGEHLFTLVSTLTAFWYRFGPWEKHWRTADFTYVPFEPAAFVGGDLVSDFAHRIGPSIAPERMAQPQENVSFSAEAFALLFAYRTERGTLLRSGLSQGQNGQGLRALATFDGRRFRVEPRYWLHLRALQAYDRRWATKRMGRSFAPFAPRDDDVVFRGKREILRFAEASLPVLQAHLGDRYVPRPTPREELVANMDTLFRVGDVSA